MKTHSQNEKSNKYYIFYMNVKNILKLSGVMFSITYNPLIPLRENLSVRRSNKLLRILSKMFYFKSTIFWISGGILVVDIEGKRFFEWYPVEE